MSSDSGHWEELQKEGKILAAAGRLYESLDKFEQASKIKETPKILQRIQRLKDVISEQTSKCKSRFTGAKDNSNNKKTNESEFSTIETEETCGVLSQIQNKEIDLKKKHLPTNPAELSPETLKKFTELKTSAIELSYDGKFQGALYNFSEAQKLCDCPKLKKYKQEIEMLISKHSKKLDRFQSLTDTGKKLASSGKQTESLEKLKNAFAVLPSPKVSKMIKLLEAKENPPPKFPTFSASSLDESIKEKGSEVSIKIAQALKVSPPLLPSKENSSTFASITDSSDASATSPTSTTCGIKSPTNPADLSPEAKSRFKSLYSKAREQAGAGKLQEALDTLLEAKVICPSEKILKRIEDLKEHIKRQSVELSSDMTEVSNGFFIFHEIYDKLYPYQREGVAWMWDLFQKNKGGILGDDMGLGKTFQVIAFLSGLIDAELIKHVLIIMPVSLIPNWCKEFKKWCPGISVSQYHGSSKTEKERNLLRIQRRGHVLLTSYGMVLNAKDSFSNYEGSSFVWDYVILDEGHKIKNPTKTTKAVHAVPSKNRLVLTGTPVQNNLRELWSLYDFAHQGTLLGSQKTFRMQYENTITRAREKDAKSGEKILGTKMAENLKKIIQPYFLRRSKAEVWGNETHISDNIQDLEQGIEQLRLADNRLKARKNDLIVWTQMSDAQCDIYRNFLHSAAVKTILISKRSPLVELTILKKICDHPRLLSQRACLQLGLNGDLKEEELHRELSDEATYSSSIENVSDETLMAESGKMKFLIELLENLKSEGHRTLVFSLSRKILDMVHRILINRKWKVMRIDGSISKIEERARRIQLFQQDQSYPVFLLTTQVGGVGITLTAADRVIIYDPSWNPATDAQAVDRVYRIGQQKNVIVYRLITCGTVEEKIYRRQIFKDSITKQATCSSTDPYRYFSKQELRELFTLDDPFHSATQVQLSQLHSDQRTTDVSLDAHIAFIHSLGIFGISDHDLMFTKDIKDHTEDDDESTVSHDFIRKQVEVAQTQIQTEASVVAEGLRLAGTYTRPYTEHIPTLKKNKEPDLYKPPSFPEVIDLVNMRSKRKSSEYGQTRKSQENVHLHSDKSSKKYEILSSERSEANFYNAAAVSPGVNANKKMNSSASEAISPADSSYLIQSNGTDNSEYNIAANYSSVLPGQPKYSVHGLEKKEHSVISLTESNSIRDSEEMNNLSYTVNANGHSNSLKDLEKMDDSVHSVAKSNSIHDLEGMDNPSYTVDADSHSDPFNNQEKMEHSVVILTQSNFNRDFEEMDNPSYTVDTNGNSNSGHDLEKMDDSVVSVAKSNSIHDLEGMNDPTCTAEANGSLLHDLETVNHSVSDLETSNVSIHNNLGTMANSLHYLVANYNSIQDDLGTMNNSVHSLVANYSSIHENLTDSLQDIGANNDSIHNEEENNKSALDVEEENLSANDLKSMDESVHGVAVDNDNSSEAVEKEDSSEAVENEDSSEAVENEDSDHPDTESASSDDEEECSEELSENEYHIQTSLRNSMDDTSDGKPKTNIPVEQSVSLLGTVSSEYESVTSGSSSVPSNGASPSAVPFDGASPSSDLKHSTPMHGNDAASYDDVYNPGSFPSSPLRQSPNPSRMSASRLYADFSFDDKPVTVVSKRKSCARPSVFVASDSDSIDSEDGDYSDALNASSAMFVPSSLPNSPAVVKGRTLRHAGEVPPSPLRITPLKVRKSFCPAPDPAFAAAMATSPFLHRTRNSSDSEVDSPIKVFRKKTCRNIIDSDED